ncbi:zf-HC2 domain-containing protein [Kangiella taiwanensis]|uniref:Putative zinc-finger domain-containing protein n=1 Tax=Kangiella taiwanensis TaxID=1079179 RepID=A0ABP8HVV2_9GAMM|nr:zf-HC2 domain-containing protein [Kangiella taiwanensis]
MLSCKHTIAQGTDYLDKELSFWRKVEMKMHLMICVNCRRYVKQLKQTVVMLSKGQFKQPSEQQVEQLKKEYQEVSSKQ